MQKNTWLLSILSLIIVVLVGILIFVPGKTKAPKIVGGEALAGNSDFKIFSLNGDALASEYSSPLEIVGAVYGGGWSGFEGQVGTVELLDSNNKSLALGVLTATTEWTKLPTSFETTLNFISNNSGQATLVFRNENPSGDPAKDKIFTLPIKISASSAETMQVKVYFKSTQSNTDCNYVVAAERVIPKTGAPAKAALEELLKGYTSEERQIYGTAIPLGSKLNSISIVNGEARADFNEITQSGGGSCSMAARVAQITQTLEQFPTIKSVIISINGRTEDILQP